METPGGPDSGKNSKFANNPLITKYKIPEMHAAMTDLLGSLEPLGIAGSEACLRWLYHHSALSEEDGVILGASNGCRRSFRT